MKKTLFLFVILLLSISCSKSDDNDDVVQENTITTIDRKWQLIENFWQ